MANDPLTRSMETVNVFRDRLTSLYTLYAEVAAQHHAHVDHDERCRKWCRNVQCANVDLRPGRTPLIRVTSGCVESRFTRLRSPPTSMVGTTRRFQLGANCSALAALTRRPAGPTSMTQVISNGMPKPFATNQSQSMPT